MLDFRVLKTQQRSVKNDKYSLNTLNMKNMPEDRKNHWKTNKTEKESKKEKAINYDIVMIR